MRSDNKKLVDHGAPGWTLMGEIRSNVIKTNGIFLKHPYKILYLTFMKYIGYTFLGQRSL